MKHTITESQYYTLIGLREVAKNEWKVLESLEKAAKEITGESDENSHSNDFIHGSRELDDMLRILNITVIK